MYMCYHDEKAETINGQDMTVSLQIRGLNSVFSDTNCAVGNSECVVGICLMCSCIFSNEVVQHDTRCHLLRLKYTK